MTKIRDENLTLTKYSLSVHFNYLALQQVTHLRQVTSHGHLESLGCLGGGMVIIKAVARGGGGVLWALKNPPSQRKVHQKAH